MNDPLRRQLVELLKSAHAHPDAGDVLAGLPPDLRGAKPPGQPHTPWRLLEHLRIAQRDILDFSLGPEYRRLHWPDDYWPASDGPPDDGAWQESADAFHRDLDAMCALVLAPERDLTAPLPWGDGATLLREALLLADHNAYHLGQIVLLRRLLGAWR